MSHHFCNTINLLKFNYSTIKSDLFIVTHCVDKCTIKFSVTSLCSIAVCTTRCKHNRQYTLITIYKVYTRKTQYKLHILELYAVAVINIKLNISLNVVLLSKFIKSL